MQEIAQVASKRHWGQAPQQLHGVKSVAMTEGNMGCPHEEGEDFPLGEDCPFWKGNKGATGGVEAHGQLEGQEFRHWLQAHAAGSSAAASGSP